MYRASHVIWLAVAIFAARFAYLALVCPYDLVDDEAHYWEWSRRPALSYYTKGPGVAWTIWLGTRVFGHTELGVRIGAPLAGLVAMLGLGVLTAHAAGRPPNWRAGTIAVALLGLASIFQGTSLLMTIDMPYVACWILAAGAALGLCRAWQSGRGGWAWALGLGAALGIGFLYKYTILLLIPGLAWHVVARRSEHTRAPVLGSLAVVALAFAASIWPVLLWNHLRGWPTVMHLLGHLKLKGGDSAVGSSYTPVWTLLYLITPLGVLGPPLALAIAGALRWTWQTRTRTDAGERGLLVALAVPIFAFYLAVTARTDVEANWNVAGFATLLALAALWLAREEPGAGPAWRWTLRYGVFSAVVVHAMPLLLYIPGAAQATPLYRITGRQAQADAVHAARCEVARAYGLAPGEVHVIGDYYSRASSLAFYLPDQPRVWCASTALGYRHTAYDDFADTQLDDLRRLRGPGVLLGANEEKWTRALPLDALSRVSEVGMGKRTRPVFTAVLRGAP